MSHYVFITIQQVFFDITMGGEPIGRIEMGLFGKTVPKTAANFKSLAEGFTEEVSDI